MALDDDKRKPLAAEHLAALDGLERGVTFNTTHTVARELIEMGYAFTDWGRLAITEAGRIELRRPPLRSFPIINEHVADISAQAAKLTDDPFAAPHRAGLERTGIILVEEEPSTPLPPASDDVQRAMRAAGVASGKTGVWPETEWVHAFIDAYVATSKLETPET